MCTDWQSLPAKQPVFAYLPLRSYGFRFIVQGLFIAAVNKAHNDNIKCSISDETQPRAGDLVLRLHLTFR